MPAVTPVTPNQPPDDKQFVGRGIVLQIQTGDTLVDDPWIEQEEKGLVTRYDTVSGANTLSHEVVDRVVDAVNAQYDTDIQVVWDAVPADLQA